ncbi:MAG: hypothetical protein ACRBCI_03515 [Cellvibrionaceae bacterium]
MEIVKKIVNGICSVPVVGGYLALLVAFAPALPIFLIGIDKSVAAVIGGLLIAIWCFALAKFNIIRIVTPFLPIPMWAFGLLIAGYGAYSLLLG